MFFTNFARVIAWFLVIGGGLRAGVAFTSILENNPYIATRYLGTNNAGEAADNGLLYLLIGVGNGMVAEMSRSVAAKAELPAQNAS
ncbi:hypothetical protein [Mesorhizobium sp. M7A.F.Ce.TU.012.03.2.1]|uniref:hypothetical protein n=1 Tax=Mesorhizobium sp. M7A.F.Ce.TU.012.03.2.1 TaxID=2493681 RepID=UPI000FD9F36C|nr:hypothetical protein [Mesorhizobium sp. M7A.F.Ce.TU.012.03.2.1]AZV21593.1 hypothetical protein EJ079_22410 [Mesorhizobium sp. M7A.F.Ce.TU.012.03.2.1]